MAIAAAGTGGGNGGRVGCGSSGSSAKHHHKATPTPTPVPFAAAVAAPIAVTTDVNLPRWFILVNGKSGALSDGVFHTYCADGYWSGPAGSPNPNSGTA